MTRPGSRDHGRTPTGARPAAAYTTAELPPADTPVLRCACGGVYRDHPASEAAHHAVFGHRPIRKSAPAPAASAPAQGEN
jgi:hypothetical protein